MARTLTTAQETLYAARDRAVHTRVWVANASGTLVDHSDVMVRASYDSTVDELIDQVEVEFERGLGAASYAPLMTASPPIALGRELVFEVAITEPGTDPVSGDWLELLRGPVVAWDATRNPMRAVAHDWGHYLQKKVVKTEAEYGDDAGTEELATVMQEVLTDNGFSTTLYTPVDPLAYVTTYKVEPGTPVLQVLRDLAEGRGWTVRYRWRASTSQFELTLYEPPRSKTTADWTMSPSRYLEVREAKSDDEDVRNDIIVRYEDSDGARQTVTASDTDSITKYGGPDAVPFTMLIDLPGDDPIKTATQAQYLANACVSDVAEPDITHAVEDFCLPHIEVGDLIAFDANSVHYSAAQSLGVMSVRHEFPRPGVGRTILGCRGKPSGGVLMWRRKAKPPSRPLYQDDPAVFEVEATIKTVTSDAITYTISGGAKVDTAWIHTQVVEVGGAAAATWPEPGASVPDIGPVSLPYDLVADYAPLGYVRLYRIYGMTEDLETPGHPVNLEIPHLPPEAPVIEVETLETTSGDDAIGVALIRLQERGIAVTAVTLQTQVGDEPRSAERSPLRSEGDTGTINGTTLAANEWEHDVILHQTRISYIHAWATLETGETLVIPVPAFDRNTAPSIVSLDIVDQKAKCVGDSDVKCWRAYKTGDTASFDEYIDGSFANFDIPVGASETWNVTFDAVPYLSTQSWPPDYERASEVRMVRGSSVTAASEPRWTSVALTEPTAGSATMTIDLDAENLPGDTTDWSQKVYARVNYGSGYGSWTEITSDLSPVPGQPTATTHSDSHTWATTPTRATGGSLLVIWEVRAELLDDLGAIVDTLAATIGWTYGTSSGREVQEVVA